MTKDKENKNDSLKDFILEENVDEVEKRLNNIEKNDKFNPPKDPWNIEKEEKSNNDKDFSKKEKINSKKRSATKNYIFLILIIFFIIGIFFYLENNSSVIKNNSEIITTSKKTDNNQKNILFLNEYRQLNKSQIINKIVDKKILGEYLETKNKFTEIHYSDGSYYYKSENNTKEKIGKWQMLGDTLCYLKENNKSISSCNYIYVKKNDTKHIYFVNNKKEYIFAKSNSISNDIEINKDNKKIDNNYFNLNSNTLEKIEFSAKWSEYFNDTVIITLKNNSIYTIKEIEFWFIGKKCPNTSNPDFWNNKIKKNYIVNFHPNTTIEIKKNNLEVADLCYFLNSAKAIKN